ncbi:MAG: hypothetical protein R3B13_23240 [Polyangiaceae bacterium]
MAPHPTSSLNTASTSERGPTSGIHRAVGPQKPLLASEVLREELAPLQPLAPRCRIWIAGLAVALGLLSLGIRMGVGAPALGAEDATVGFSAAGALLAIAVLPFPYAGRAALVAVVGGVLMVLGLRSAGPLAGLSVDGGWERSTARLVALTVLPAALLFRAHYRAYARARHLLAAALLLSAPFIAVQTVLALDSSAALITRISATVSVAVVCCSLFGFMGEGTTGLSGVWAGLLWLVLAGELGLRQLTVLADAHTGYLTYPATALAALTAAVLVSLGIFQLAAAGLAPEARRLSLPGRSADSTRNSTPSPPPASA